ncbi:LysR family transcriptional regulator [Leucobacter sp. UCD-THU]|uniref:LysR family transcriptional regulator n=1 Tax=Leucobacter sp. UCD-THU TaxID=1292023 RepID=UPI000380B7C9|nr:LysR family transcriptional regulator [Leucobacter sp. UCD-THU]
MTGGAVSGMSGAAEGNLKIEWIASFLAVVDHGGFAAAATHTFRSQPRISAHIGDLERSLGAELFDRKGRPVRLTEAGIAFLGHARALLREVDAARSSVQAVLGVLRGRVKLGTFPSAGAAFVPDLLTTFRTQHPQVAVSLVEGTPAELVEALGSGEADIALRPLSPPPAESSIRYQTLWEEPLVALVPEESPMAAATFLSLREIAQEPLVTYGGARKEGGESLDEVSRALTAASVHASIAYRSNDPQTLVNLTRARLGIGLTNLLSASVTDTAGLAVVPILESGNRRQVGVFWDSAHAMQPATRALMHLITQFPVPQAIAQYQRRGFTTTRSRTFEDAEATG